jgi:hypothetical protein
MVGRPRRAMATLAPAYSLVISAVLAAVELEMALLIACVPFVVVSAIPLLARGSRAFNGACYTATVLLVCGGCLSGGVWFLPAALPLLFATPPGLSLDPPMKVGWAGPRIYKVPSELEG